MSYLISWNPLLFKNIVHVGSFQCFVHMGGSDKKLKLFMSGFINIFGEIIDTAVAVPYGVAK